MPDTHTSLHFHLVFSTKNRAPWLTANHCLRLHGYLGGIIKSLDGVPHAVGACRIMSTCSSDCDQRTD